MITIKRIDIAPEWAEFAYELADDGIPIMLVGFIPKNLFTRTYAFWIDPRAFEPRHVRPLRKMFQLACEELHLICNVSTSNVRALRLANLFGFREVERGRDIIIMERARG